MNITVFGGSEPKNGEKAYEDALRLGRLLGAEGYTVLTGGYIGTMEAVSRGAMESGGYVIGITCDEIEHWRPVTPNQWIHEERRFPTLRQRLFSLVEDCDVALALPGGIGTLAEISIMWSHMQTQSIAIRPLVLIGPGWSTMISTLYTTFGDYISDKYRSLLNFTPDIDTTVEYIRSLDKSKGKSSR
jgi:uncharacterized protein (TIGR00730 family)